MDYDFNDGLCEPQRGAVEATEEVHVNAAAGDAALGAAVLEMAKAREAKGSKHRALFAGLAPRRPVWNLNVSIVEKPRAFTKCHPSP